MKTTMTKQLFLVMLVMPFFCKGQISESQDKVEKEKRVFLFVHGAWGGGWEYSEVDAILTAKGDMVYHPTLTGLGERVHLAEVNINLTTHVADIVNVINILGCLKIFILLSDRHYSSNMGFPTYS